MAILRNIDPATTVVTSTYIMNDGMPILYISCDDDEEGGVIWQAHCGNGDYNMKKILLVRVDTILDMDNSIEDVDLVVGQEAVRSSTTSDWTIRDQ